MLPIELHSFFRLTQRDATAKIEHVSSWCDCPMLLTRYMMIESMADAGVTSLVRTGIMQCKAERYGHLVLHLSTEAPLGFVHVNGLVSGM